MHLRDLEELISAFLDDELGEAERVVLEEKLRSPEVAQILKEFGLVRSAIRSLPVHRVPRDFWLRSVNKIRTTLSNESPLPTSPDFSLSAESAGTAGSAELVLPFVSDQGMGSADGSSWLLDLQSFVDGELSPTERESVEQRLSDSQEAQIQLQELQDARDLLSSLPRVALPASFAESLSGRLDQESQEVLAPTEAGMLAGLPRMKAPADFTKQLLLRLHLIEFDREQDELRDRARRRRHRWSRVGAGLAIAASVCFMVYGIDWRHQQSTAAAVAMAPMDERDLDYADASLPPRGGDEVLQFTSAKGSVAVSAPGRAATPPLDDLDESEILVPRIVASNGRSSRRSNTLSGYPGTGRTRRDNQKSWAGGVAEADRSAGDKSSTVSRGMIEQQLLSDGTPYWSPRSLEGSNARPTSVAAEVFKLARMTPEEIDPLHNQELRIVCSDVEAMRARLSLILLDNDMLKFGEPDPEIPGAMRFEVTASPSQFHYIFEDLWYEDREQSLIVAANIPSPPVVEPVAPAPAVSPSVSDEKTRMLASAPMMEVKPEAAELSYLQDLVQQGRASRALTRQAKAKSVAEMARPRGAGSAEVADARSASKSATAFTPSAAPGVMSQAVPVPSAPKEDRREHIQDAELAMAKKADHRNDFSPAAEEKTAAPKPTAALTAPTSSPVPSPAPATKPRMKLRSELKIEFILVPASK